MKTGSQNWTEANADWPRRWVVERRKPSGVALVATLIMLSLVTFMTVAFLGVARRERRSMEAHLNQGDARHAMDAALQAAQAELVGRLLSIHPNDPTGLTPDPWGYTLFVSTNYMNHNPLVANVFDDTNVNDILASAITRNNGGAPTDWLMHLRNLRLKPRAPVYSPLFTNGFTEVSPYHYVHQNGSRISTMEEMLGRFYLDFNRNGYYEPTFTRRTGEFWEGNAAWVSNVHHFEGHYVGDPHWIGILENPNEPHSSSNRFIARYAFVVMPAGKSLDLNHIHNQNKWLNVNRTDGSLVDGYMRNHGAAGWELNLAAFLSRLNENTPSSGSLTNPWYYGDYTPYNANAALTYTTTNGSFPANSFSQANDFLRWRFDGDFNYKSVALTYSNIGAERLSGLGFDINGSDLMGFETPPYLYYHSNNFAQSWIGSTNNSVTNLRLFSILDLFNSEPDYSGMRSSLTNYSASSSNITSFTFGAPGYARHREVDNRYTFYRMISQMGTETDSRIDRPNLNWDNLLVTRSTLPSGTVVTNSRFVAPDDVNMATSASFPAGNPLYVAQGPFAKWEPLRFFTNVAQALLTASVRTNVTVNSATLNPPANAPNWVYITNYSIGRASVDTNRFTLLGGQTRTNVNGTWNRLGRVFFYNQPNGSRIARQVYDNTLELTNITIWPFNQFTPEVRRIVQVAANLHETSGNSREWMPDINYATGNLVRRFGHYYRATGSSLNDDPSDGGAWAVDNPGLPHVFRPIYAADTNLNRVYIQRWTNQLGTNWVSLTSLSHKDTNDFVALANATAAGNNDQYLMKGFPVFFGAKGPARVGATVTSSGIPNFNEVSYRTLVTVTRKLEMVKTNSAQFFPEYTNMMFIVGIKAGMVAEAWQPFQISYPRPLEMRATNYMTIQLTNQFGPIMTTNITNSGVYTLGGSTWPTMQWPNGTNIANFQTPLGGHMQVLSNSAYYPPEFSGLAGVGTNGGFRNVNSAYQPGSIFAGSNSYPNIELGISFSNHLTYVLIDTFYNQVIDYVNLDDLSGGMDLIDMITTRTNRQGDPNLYIGNFWTTNRLASYINGVHTGGTNINDIPIGVYNQIAVAMDPNRANQVNWINYDPNVANIAARIQDFRDFIGGRSGELRKEVPFSPTVVAKQDLIFEVNDPIVHYTVEDLTTAVGSGIPSYDSTKTYQLNDPVTVEDPVTGVVNTYRANDFTLPGELPGSPLNNKWRLISLWFAGNTYTNGSEVVHQSDVYTARAFAPINSEPGTITGRMWRRYTANAPSIVVLSGQQMRELEDTSQITTLIGLPGSGGKMNGRYQPWGGNPSEQNESMDKLRNYNLAIKDPAIYNPDDWDFPERKFASIGWMGRVHRGTPWQTLYMKARPEPRTNWVAWAGDQDTHPTNDWRFFDALTATVSEKASRGLLSVNQTNVAAWAAALGGTKFQELSGTGRRWVQPTVTNDWVNPMDANFDYIYAGIMRTRTNRVSFRSVGDLLSVPELSDGSPYLYRAVSIYNSSFSYPQGSYVMHRGILYRANRPPNVPAGVEPPRMPQHLLPNYNINNAYTEGTEVMYRGLFYRATMYVNPGIAPPGTGAGEWEWGWGESSQVANPEKWGFTDGMVESLPQNVMGLLKLERHPRVVIYAFGQALAPAEQSVYLFPGVYQGMVTNYRVIGESSSRAVLRVEGIPEPGLIPFTTNAAAAVFPRVIVEDYQELGKL